MDNNLRDKILETSIELFNKKGYAYVTLRDISDALNISPGNLTYHFKKKQDLMIGVMARQYEEYQNLNFSADVSIQGLNQQFLILSAFREKYFFYFSSFTELPKLYPEIADMQIKVVNDFYTLFTDTFTIFVNNGIMKEELYAGQYEDLSISLLSLNMYGTQEIILLQKFLPKQKSVFSILWSLILPHLTREGTDMYNRMTQVDKTPPPQLYCQQDKPNGGLKGSTCDPKGT
ncbi:TetR/AcrR family transcriptional regulator [Paenibacillus sp. FSL L8-0470]|uniref:TetR/AcrR family transcriptional regulator n=1 Tax=unclassified Paenibacillus TaxID=185978 RepID=UPI0030F79BFE